MRLDGRTALVTGATGGIGAATARRLAAEGAAVVVTDPKIRAAIERLDGPGRRYDPRPLTEPPFYILEAAPAITYTLGGLLIDPDARVRARGGGVVPGLLAAGADAGGLYHQAYAGGLAATLVFGLAAARTA